MSTAQPVQDESFRRLSWILIQDYKMLFVRKLGTELWFDPGCRKVEGESEVVTLSKKMREDLGVELNLATMRKLTSFGASAHDKPEGTMVEICCYVSDYIGPLTPREGLEMAWIGRDDLLPTSDASTAIRERIKEDGLV